MLVLGVGLVIPLAVALTPSAETTVAGQYVAVGGTTPSGGWVGDVGEIVDDGPTTWPRAVLDGLTGPAEVQQIGDTTIELQRVQVRGPLRPQLELGPLVRTRAAEDLLDPDEGPAARRRAEEAVTAAVRTWYLRATGLLLLLTMALVAVGTSARIWAVMAGAHRDDHQLTVAAVWHRHARRIAATALVPLVGTLAVWAGVSALAWHDTSAGLSGVRSLRDLVGAAPVELRPAGPPVEGYTGAVVGDSRASRLGGPALTDPDPDEAACERSTDSLAAQLTQLSSDRVLNLACPSATISNGLLGEQRQGGRTLRPQVERLLALRDLRFVVVMIGPNDLAWSDFLRYCYGVEECDDRFTSGQFDYRLARFDRDYGDLLAALATLADRPQVIVVTSYDVFGLDADCSDTQVSGHPGLDSDGLAVFADRTDRLNAVLTAGAEAYGYAVATPHLATLCEPGDPAVGRDLQGLSDPYPFHPTGVGMVRLAASVLTEIDPPAPATASSSAGPAAGGP